MTPRTAVAMSSVMVAAGGIGRGSAVLLLNRVCGAVSTGEQQPSASSSFVAGTIGEEDKRNEFRSPCILIYFYRSISTTDTRPE